MKYILFLLLTAAYSAAAQTLTAEEKILEDWLPASIGDFKPDGSPATITSSAEDKPYIMSSRNYKKGAATLTIVIFDYGKDNDVLKKYTDSWASPSPENATQAASVDDFPAWQSVSTTKNVTELYVNVKDRYLLYLSTKGSSITFLKAVVKELKPRQLPQ